MTIEIKTFKVDLSKAIKADKPGEGSAVIAELNVVDHDGDVTLPGAFGTQHVNMLPAHDRGAPRLGKAVLTEADDMAIADFKFNLSADAVTAKEWYASLKFDMENGDPLQEWSYGFEILDSEFGQFQGKDVRFLKSLKVFEISPVLRGAGIGTGTLAIKEKQTFKDEMDNALSSLDDIKAFAKRSASLADVKAKDGKSLSDEQIEALKVFNTSLDEVLQSCGDVIQKASKGKINVEILRLEYEKTLSKYGHLIGV